MQITHTSVGSILTRTGGFLATVASHTLQPYRGCALGNSLCGVGCYVRHNIHVTNGAEWGSFVDVRINAAEVYAEQYAAERNWARDTFGRFSVFLSSSTEPFQPLERKHHVTRSVLEEMVLRPPDELIVQTHSPHVTDYLQFYADLAARTALRFHISIESDIDALPGLPPPASSVADRLAAAAKLKKAGLRTVITVSPLFPMADPERFFAKVAESADAVVIDHFLGGDGSRDGKRTLRTALPAAMAAVDPQSVTLDYRARIVDIARRIMPGRVGVNVDGFAGRMLEADFCYNPKP
jgi:DNA repair photolyase